MTKKICFSYYSNLVPGKPICEPSRVSCTSMLSCCDNCIRSGRRARARSFAMYGTFGRIVGRVRSIMSRSCPKTLDRCPSSPRANAGICCLASRWDDS